MLYLCILGNLTKYMIVSYDNLFFIGKAPKRHREKKKVQHIFKKRAELLEKNKGNYDGYLVGVKPKPFAVFSIYSKAASCSLGMIPSKIASFMAFFSIPISLQGERWNVCMISSPSTGGWKLRMRSFSSKSFNF